MGRIVFPDWFAEPIVVWVGSFILPNCPLEVFSLRGPGSLQARICDFKQVIVSGQTCDVDQTSESLQGKIRTRCLVDFLIEFGRFVGMRWIFEVFVNGCLNLRWICRGFVD